MSQDNTTNRVKFTVGRVRVFECPDDKSEAKLWDSDVKALILRARRTGSKAYYFQDRLNGKLLRIKIGDVSEHGISLQDARKQALEYQKLVRTGRDPRLEIRRRISDEKEERRRITQDAIKFGDVWQVYIDENKDSWSDAHLKDHHKAMQSPNKKRKRGSAKTVAGVLYRFRLVRLGEIDSIMVLGWLKKESKSRPIVVARGYRLLRACLNWADGREEYRGVVDVIRLFKNSEIKKALPKSKPKQDVLMKQQVQPWFEVIQQLDNLVISAYLQCLLLTGARREELASVEWIDVDFKWCAMTIRDKVEGERTIPLTPYVAFLMSSLPRRNQWVFSSPQSKSGRLRDPYRSHAAALKRADIPHVSLHGLRRSFGSLSEWVECPAGISAQIQGHKPSATVEKHYRVRPLDLLTKWHTKIENEILEFAGLDQPECNFQGIRLAK